MIRIINFNLPSTVDTYSCWLIQQFQIHLWISFHLEKWQSAEIILMSNRKWNSSSFFTYYSYILKNWAWLFYITKIWATEQMTGYSDFQFISWWKNSSLVSFNFIFKAYLCPPSSIVDAIRQLTDISIVTSPNYFSSGTNYRDSYIQVYMAFYASRIR